MKKNILLVLMIFAVVMCCGCVSIEDPDENLTVDQSPDNNDQANQSHDDDVAKSYGYKTSSSSDEGAEISCPSCGSPNFEAIGEEVDQDGDLHLENRCLNCGFEYWINAGPSSDYQ